jgi:beta-glucanase (GH16 family)
MMNKLNVIFPRYVLSVVILFSINILSENVSGQTNNDGLNVPAGWNQVFSEDFNGTSLNTDLWRPGLPYPDVDHLNDELEHYRTDNIKVADGICTLQATKDGSGNIYSGCITTKIGYQYGHTEARIRFPKGKGFWPAYWTTSSEGRWPPEWDILEVINTNNDIYGYIHPLKGGKWTFEGGAAGSDCLYTSVEGAPNIYDQFVIFGFTWTATDLYWYVNGVMTEHFSVNSAAGSNDRFWILLNLAVGGKWPGNPDETTPWPGNMQIDYVRLWQPAAGMSALN